MAIDAREVLRIARLAHLEYPESPENDGLFDEGTLLRLAEDIDRILEHVRDLETVDVTDVEKTAHGVFLPTRTRSDAPSPSLDPDRALSGAPSRDGDAFSVPKVVE